MHRRLAIVRRPGPRLAEGLVTFGEPAAVDLDRARAQWDCYADAMRSAGWQLVEVPSADDCPDAVFVEDAVVVYGDLAVIARPGAEQRRGEIKEVERTVRDLGYRVARISRPGTLDGGDVLKFRRTAYVGLSSRTNGAGIQQLAKHLSEFDVRIQAVPVERALHLKSAATILPDGTAIGWDPVVDDREAFESYQSMPEPAGAHTVILDATHLLMAASAPQSAELLRARGYDVSTVDISEFEKLDGCVTCLSVRLRG